LVAHRRALGVNVFRALVVIVACAAACSSYGTEEKNDVAPPPEREAGADAPPATDAATTDASGDAAAGDGALVTCDRSKLFGAPTVVPGLTSDEYEQSARLTDGELGVFWARYDNVEWAIWTASRASSTDPFGDALKLAVVNDPVAADLDPSPTSDGRSLYFTSQRDGGVDIYRATRPSSASPFGAPQPFVEANTSAEERRPFVAPDGQSLWFDSKRTGVSRIYRMSLSTFGTGNAEMIDLGATDTIADEAPVISHDGLALYFSGVGRDDGGPHVYMATRANSVAKFGTPMRIDTWAGFSVPTWITADDCRLYVTVGATAGTRIRMVERAK
jgi:hypothetical protein